MRPRAAAATLLPAAHCPGEWVEMREPIRKRLLLGARRSVIATLLTLPIAFLLVAFLQGYSTAPGIADIGFIAVVCALLSALVRTVLS